VHIDIDRYNVFRVYVCVCDAYEDDNMYAFAKTMQVILLCAHAKRAVVHI
jgi:hypothetical protein